MSTAAYIANSGAWSIAGFVVGYIVCSITREVHETHTEVHEIKENLVPHQTPPSGTKPARRRRIDGTQVLGLMILLLALATGVSQLAALGADRALRTEQQRQADCLAGYANGFADALEARTEASADAQAALDDLFTVVGEVVATPDGDDGRFRGALEEYLAKREESVAAQRANPYPPAPRDVCPPAGD